MSEKAIVIVGKENQTESYQLLIGTSYISTTYQGEEKYEDFLENVSERFTTRILESGLTLEVGIFNGYKINEQGLTKIERLNTQLLESKLASKLNKMSQGRGLIIPVARGI